MSTTLCSQEVPFALLGQARAVDCTYALRRDEIGKAAVDAATVLGLNLLRGLVQVARSDRPIVLRT